MVVEGVDPLSDVLAVAPGGLAQFIDGSRRLLESRHDNGDCRFSLGARIEALIGLGAIVDGNLPGTFEADLVDGSKAEVSAPTVDDEAHHPALATGTVDLEIETSAVGVTTGCRQGFDTSRRQATQTLRMRTTTHGSLPGCRSDTPHILPHTNERDGG
jgi:hypothetical protein